MRESTHEWLMSGCWNPLGPFAGGNGTTIPTVFGVVWGFFVGLFWGGGGAECPPTLHLGVFCLCLWM